jgi:hypothetical protein
MSRLAVVALVLAVLPCPPVMLIGGTLGLIALRRIQASHGALGGRRIALAAALTGAALTLISTALYTWFVSAVTNDFQAIMTRHTEEAVRHAAAGQSQLVVQRWSKDAAASIEPAEIEAFGGEAAQRYGALERFDVTSMYPRKSRTWLGGGFDIAGIFRFENAERTGAASFEYQPGFGSPTPLFRILSLRIDDAEQGDLQLPTPDAK